MGLPSWDPLLPCPHRSTLTAPLLPAPFLHVLSPCPPAQPSTVSQTQVLPTGFHKHPGTPLLLPEISLTREV